MVTQFVALIAAGILIAKGEALQAVFWLGGAAAVDLAAKASHAIAERKAKRALAMRMSKR